MKGSLLHYANPSSKILFHVFVAALFIGFEPELGYRFWGHINQPFGDKAIRVTHVRHPDLCVLLASGLIFDCFHNHADLNGAPYLFGLQGILITVGETVHSKRHQRWFRKVVHQPLLQIKISIWGWENGLERICVPQETNFFFLLEYSVIKQDIVPLLAHFKVTSTRYSHIQRRFQNCAHFKHDDFGVGRITNLLAIVLFINVRNPAGLILPVEDGSDIV